MGTVRLSFEAPGVGAEFGFGRGSGGRDGGAALLEGPYRQLAAMMACKRAVKAGRRLGPEEIASLLEKADLADDPRHCPHGRPTSVMLSGRELEAKFDRK